MTASTQAADTAAAPAAKPPLAAPAATSVTVALGLIVIAVGVIAGRDALIGVGAIDGSPWMAAALRFLDGLTAQPWMVPAGIAAALVGLALLVAAVKPRKRTHRATKAPDTWITSRDVQRIARGAARAITGVAEVTAGGSPRKLSLTVTTVPGYGRAELDAAVRAAVTAALEPLASPPRLKTRLKERDSS